MARSKLQQVGENMKLQTINSLELFKQNTPYTTYLQTGMAEHVCWIADVSLFGCYFLLFDADLYHLLELKQLHGEPGKEGKM